MSKFAKATVGLMIVTMISKILGFARELILASIYGASMYSDAYLTAMNIPTVIFTGIGAAIATTFIPLFHEAKDHGGINNSMLFTNNILNIVSIICIILSLIGIVFSEQIVKLFAIGFEGETLYIATRFTKILMCGMLFIGISNIMTAYLQVNNNFNIPGFITVPKNIIIICFMLISIKNGPYFMVWGTLIGMLSEVLFQLPFVIKNGYKYRMYLNIKDKYIKKCIWLLGPVFIGVAVNQVNTMIDRTLASTLAEGSISALNYANKLNGFVVGLFIASIVTVIYPMLSQLSSEKNMDQLKNTVTKSVNAIIILIIPISVGAITLSTPIVKLLFQRGEFDARATSMTSIALIMYSLGMVAFGLRDILGKVFYSLQDTKTPMKNGIISMILNIVFNLITIKFMGHAGLALGTSLSSISCIILLFISLDKKIGNFGQEKILITLSKSILSAIIMGIIVVLTNNIVANRFGIGVLSQIIELVCSILIGVISYAIALILLRVEEIYEICNINKFKLINKLHKQKI